MCNCRFVDCVRCTAVRQGVGSGVGVHVWGRETCDNSVYLLIHFAVNPKLL
jgi:hypothetical protein